MEKVVVKTDKAPAAIGPYSAGIRAGNFVFTAGQIPLDPDTGVMADTIEEQTRQSLSNVKAILEAAGTDLAHVVKTTVFLQSMGDFAAMNGVYAEFFTENCPARSAVEVACLPKNAKVEIEAIALID